MNLPHNLRQMLGQTVETVILTGPFRQADLCRALGKASSTVSGWVNHGELPGAPALLGLSLLLSSEGDHRLARLFSLPDYDVVPVAVSPGWHPSGSHLGELDRIIRALGEASRATEAGEVHRAEALLTHMQTALVAWSRELAYATARAA